jgi:hypothetical protein
VYLTTQQIQNYYLTEIEERENAGRMNRISESRDDTIWLHGRKQRADSTVAVIHEQLAFAIAAELGRLAPPTASCRQL